LSRSKPRKPQPLLLSHHPGSNLFVIQSETDRHSLSTNFSRQVVNRVYNRAKPARLISLPVYHPNRIVFSSFYRKQTIFDEAYASGYPGK
jgi:hypothetical protein